MGPAGPFSQYLTEAPKPRMPQASGYEGPAATIAMVAGNFFDGLRQARMQQAALQEQESQKVERGTMAALEAVNKATHLDPLVRERLAAPLQQALIQHIAGVKEPTPEHKSNPFFQMIKQTAMNMGGGALPAKSKGLDPNLIGSTFTELMNPENTVQHKFSIMAKGGPEMINRLGIKNREALVQNPEALAHLNEYRRLRGDQEAWPDYFASLPVNEVEQKKQELNKTYMQIISGKINSGSNVPPTGQPPTPRNPFDYHSEWQTMSGMAKGLGVSYPRPEGKFGNVVNFIDESNRRFQGVPVQGLSSEGIPDGTYDILTGKIVANPTPVSPYNLTNATTTVKRVLNPGEGESEFKRTVKPNGDVVEEQVLDATGKPVTSFGSIRQPHYVSGVDGYGRPTLQVIPATTEKPASLLNKKQAPVTGLPPTQGNPPVQNKTKVPARTNSEQAPLTKAPAAKAVPVTQNEYDEPPKVPGVIYRGPAKFNDKVRSTVINDLIDGVVSTDDINSQYKDSATQFFNLVREQGFQPFNKKEIEGVKAISTLSNKILPLYEQLAEAVKGEKNPQIQWAEGKLITSLTNPHVNSIIGEINAEASNVAKALGGELRATDADALRMLGMGPNAMYTHAENLRLIRAVKGKMMTVAKGFIPGASDAQISRIMSRYGGRMKAINQGLQGLPQLKHNNGENPFVK